MSTMRAAIVEKFGDELTVGTTEIPEPGPGQALVKVIASGVCHTDLHAAEGDWPIKPNLPLVPGHEGVGNVVKIGEGVTEVKVGDLSSAAERSGAQQSETETRAQNELTHSHRAATGALLRLSSDAAMIWAGAAMPLALRCAALCRRGAPTPIASACAIPKWGTFFAQSGLKWLLRQIFPPRYILLVLPSSSGSTISKGVTG